MALYPVIMCGGAGTRLWPASRPSRPKQFIPLAGNRSLFQETVVRVAPLAGDEGRLIVVGGVRHRDWIVDQLSALEIEAQVLLEPEARDSAAAMAAAAAWAARHDPEAIIAFVASDHHIPDHEAFRQAVTAAAAGAAEGRIVTLGVMPSEPSQAYGYIKPSGRGLSAVDSFVEKPGRTQAQTYIDAGYLWNSGNFIVSAAALIDELAAHAPAVIDAARSALPEEGSGAVQTLGSAFAASPKISIDYAVMEKTARASVLEVDFAWSDLGAWDSIAASGEGDTGQHIFEDADGCLVRAPDGILVAALGVRNLAIVVEEDAVLVCDLSQSQGVKKVVERIKATSPRHLDFTTAPPEGLAEGAIRFADWMRLKALPVWSTLGQATNGGFAEVLSLEGRALTLPRRARVQARQIFVYANAGMNGWQGPWRGIVERGLQRLYSDYVRPDGLCRTTLTPEGAPLDETPYLYDQAFVLFALSAAKSAGIDDPTLEDRAIRLRDALLAAGPATGGLIEAGEQPYQSNAHMHLLEACLGWEAAGGDAGWTALADRVVDLALTRFIDPNGGFLREYFGADWAPAAGEDGRLVEPGHQFEWAWLLARVGRARDRADLTRAAQRLYAAGRRGVSERPMIAIDALNDDGSVRSHRARLWPQTEWLKASLILAETATDGERQRLMDDAATALRALWLYLTPDGLWRDKRLPRGGFIDEPAPASSLYHIAAAFGQLAETGRVEGLRGMSDIGLG
ncbi:MAG: mannose-1-phosphate guanylyltransferase [Brevundimonas subvibrioides]|uniref:Mannose-1-phosphate guanylyltransferase n=1 Tax=Brevundimonas subvibrioides TaxID=74313 RepID=A0A258HH45_9CAUL|nr:AGE family epimerase/isomerase [Brevundimonas subvibrioides]OYX56335.1 MAG: mannose-1-phosphate guanylyltransferase [Brevundimonas subvibrioides]